MSKVKYYMKKNIVLIPAGTEHMRKYQDKQKWISSNSKMSIPGTKNNLEESKHDVEIRSFYLSKYPVTVGLYDAITKIVPLVAEFNSVPKVDISWLDAVKFCNLLSQECGFSKCYSFENDSIFCDFESNGYRLPTEAEWQYACKAGSDRYQYGEINGIAWHINNSEGRIHEVGKKEPNAYGLYDMLGNVWEWCWDLYDEEKYGSYRVFRGGSWACGERESGATCRKRSFPTFSIDDLGFRVAKSMVKD